VYNIAIVSPFRDSEAYITGYIDQIYALDYPPECLRVHCIEGDSTDNTKQLLADWTIADDRITLIQYDTGKARFDSVVSQDRFKHLAGIFNTCLDTALADDWADYVFMLPSDVAIQPGTINTLVERNKDIIAPMFWKGDHPNGCRFYDIWGFRMLDGQPLPPNAYAYYQANFETEKPVEMDTIGGAMLARRDVLDSGVRYTPEDVDRGLCWTAKANGFSVWCDPQAHAIHR